MFKKSLAVLVLAIALPAPALAGSNTSTTTTNHARTLDAFGTTPGSNASRKSERQKCLDMLLPQDGADCLKKLKAKKK